MRKCPQCGNKTENGSGNCGWCRALPHYDEKPLFWVNNKWRERWVSVHPHPSDNSLLITVGRPIADPYSEPIVCEEKREDWGRYKEYFTPCEGTPPTFVVH